MDDDTRAHVMSVYVSVCVCCTRKAFSGGSVGSEGGGGGEKCRGTLGKTPLRRVTPSPLFLQPIYRLLLLALCYYCYQVLFTPRRWPPLLYRRCRPFRLIAYNVELFIARQLCVWNIPSAVLCRTTHSLWLVINTTGFYSSLQYTIITYGVLFIFHYFTSLYIIIIVINMHFFLSI